ncbi:MAG: hypothetical protein JWN02_946 [Acidobacteria bacterium]|nr:hypothetical protein [Acidobacteriota bacterium]
MRGEAFPASSPRQVRAEPLALLVLFLAAFFVFAFLFLRMAILYDSDSYYHLAVARHYAANGVSSPIPWARFSLLGNGGDKDLLFHLLLVPFATLMDAPIGGRLALALLNATLAFLIARFALRAIGWWGLAVPLWLWISAPLFFARVVRLRPELLALLILLVAIDVFASRQENAGRRWQLAKLFALGVAFAYAYTAFHVFLALLGGWTAYDWWRARSPRSLALFGAGTMGTIAGLWLRPHPWGNLQIWFAQNVSFFLNMGRLDVGSEIAPPSLIAAAIASTGWLVVIVMLAVVAVRSRVPEADRAMPYAALAALFFALLFLVMARMATYLFPLATVALLLACRSAARRALTPVLFAIGVIIALPLAGNPLLVRLLRGDVTTEGELQAFGRAIPAGAKVAADWERGELYAFWAPQGRYLNVLDPVFMALPFPRRYAAQRAVFGGMEPDVPFTAKSILQSDFLAFDRTDAPPALIERMRADPRIRIRSGGYNVLLQIIPSSRFLLDWRMSNGRPLPLPDRALRTYAGFVKVATDRCVTVTRQLDDGGSFVFAPYGPATMTVDGVRVAAADQPVLGVLSHGAVVRLAGGPHLAEVRSCPANGRNGFYLMK